MPTLEQITEIMLLAVMLIGIIVIFLVLTMRIRNRIHEAGILLSIGTSVSQITMQFIYEILMVAVLVFLILIETFVIIFTVILASLPVACMKPKDILSKMS